MKLPRSHRPRWERMFKPEVTKIFKWNYDTKG